MTYQAGKFTNLASSTLATAIAATDTSLTLHSGGAANFPTTPPFNVAIGGSPNRFEIVRVTAIAGQVFSIVRGCEGTIAHSFGSGVTVELATEDQQGDLWGLGAALSNVTALYSSSPFTNNVAVVTATAGTIATHNLGMSRVNPAGNITGVILQSASFDGRSIIVVNESAFTITFDVAGTSNVADGASDVILALTAARYVWSSDTSLWYRCA